MDGGGFSLLLELDLLLLEPGLKLQHVLVPLHQQRTRVLVTLAEVGLARDEGLVALTQLCVQLHTEISINKTEKAGGHHKRIHIHLINFRNRVGKVLSHLDRGYSDSAEGIIIVTVTSFEALHVYKCAITL